MNYEVSFELAQRAVRYISNHHLREVETISFDSHEERIVYLSKDRRIIGTSDYNPQSNFKK